MKASVFSTALLFAIVAGAEARIKKNAEENADGSAKLEKDFNKVLGGNRGDKRQKTRHLSGKSGICEDCLEDFDVYYHYDPASSFYDALTRAPNDCVLAAIRDEESYYGALFAIPEGRIALTQAFLDIDTYLEDCEFDDDQLDDCDEDYNELGWENYDESDVPEDDDIWSDVDFPLPLGQLNLALGSDGLLYPVASWNNSAFDGGVYECCPQLGDVCNVFDAPAPAPAR